MVKAIFFDFDNTILDEGVLTESGRAALFYAKEKGALVFAATGRHRREFEQMPWMAGLPFDGYVTMNGSYCYVGDDVFHRRTIAPEVVRAVIEHAGLAGLSCMVCEETELYINWASEEYSKARKSHGLPVVQARDISAAPDAAVYQMVLFGENLAGFFNDLPNCGITQWAKDSYDIIPFGVNKWVGILPMLARFGLKPSEVAAIGDGHNDGEMLLNAGFSVAVGNASDEVKKCAKYVTSPMKDGGVLEAVKKLLGSEDGYGIS